jgi:hypothetical protein
MGFDTRGLDSLGGRKEINVPIGIGAAILGAAVLGGGASLLASSNSASTARDTAEENNALQSQIYNSNKKLATPYINAGNDANTALEGFLGLGGDPAASAKAFQNFLGSTGYQFNLNQGLDSVAQSKAASGLLGSGSTLKALDAYGTGLAGTYGQQYIDNLGTVANRGESGVNALTGAGQNYANASNSNNNGAATAQINANTSAATGVNDAVQRAMNAFSSLRGGSSYGGGSSYNAFSPGG